MNAAATALALLREKLACAPGTRGVVVIVPPEELSGAVNFRPISGEDTFIQRFDAARLRGSPFKVFEERFAEALQEYSMRHRGTVDEPATPSDGAFFVNPWDGEVLAAAVQVFCGQRPVGADDLAAMTARGMVCARSGSGRITAFLAAEVRQGRVLCLEPVEPPSTAADTQGADPTGKGDPDQQSVPVVETTGYMTSCGNRAPVMSTLRHLFNAGGGGWQCVVGGGNNASNNAQSSQSPRLHWRDEVNGQVG